MDAHGSLWIADFGLAHVRGNTQLTLTGEFAGTLRYASPEQPMARRVPVDQRTDVYSLGATLYELLTLQPVFDGKDHKELLRQILFDDPRPPQKLNRHVPRDLETIVLTALAKAPAHRYASAKEMAEDLHRFLNDQPIKARPEGALRWLWRKSRRYAASIALAVSAVVTAVVLLLFLLHLNKPSPEEVDRKRMQKALATHVQDLEQKKKVILIEGRGEPGYYKWRTDEKLGKILPAQDGAFSVQNWEYGLVELLPDPRLERYRFSVEVRHERQANQESRVGLYFAHRASSRRIRRALPLQRCFQRPGRCGRTCRQRGPSRQCRGASDPPPGPGRTGRHRQVLLLELGRFFPASKARRSVGPLAQDCR